MHSELGILIITAVTIACLHTVTGPDHYLPFIALAKTRNWSLARTLLWTAVCGCGHVASSVLLGLGGAAIGWSFARITWFETVRGGIAGWALLLFGLAYGVWGWIQAKHNRRHKHFGYTEDGSPYVFEHKRGEWVPPGERYPVTPWVMFIIFVLGPCEPMIPLLYFPAVRSSWHTLLILVAVYTACTLAVMAAMVMLGYLGTSLFSTQALERYVHALGGMTLCVCGAGMVFMGW